MDLLLIVIGAICMLIIAGGALSMVDAEPTPAHLASGAALGAGLGAAASVYGTDLSAMTKMFEAPAEIPDMKVGLPVF
jgi:hypothetical protein